MPDTPDTPTRRQGDIRPVPDPTQLTTEALHREIQALRELLTTQINGNNAVVLEMFRSIENHFQLMETQRIEQKSDTQKAVDAALTAQKDQVKEQTTASERAIATANAATKEQLNQLNVTFATAIGGVTEAVGDLKERVGKIEYVRIGGQERVTETRQSMAAAYALAGFLVSILTIVGLLAATGVFGR
jgi:hypothetical protein